jgi:rhodanese-related sulfurtransferase
MIKEITPPEVEKLLLKGKEFSIIDVREKQEVAQGKIPEAVHIPLGEIPYRLNEIDSSKQHIIVCRSGARSGSVTQYLAAQGFNVKNMIGGMIDWRGTVKKV